MTKEKKNGHGGIRERTDITARQGMLAQNVREAGFPDCFWWGVPGRPANRLYLTRQFGLATYIDFEEGTTLTMPRFGTSNVRDDKQRHELALNALPAFEAALVLGPEGPDAAEQLERDAAIARQEITR